MENTKIKSEAHIRALCRSMVSSLMCRESVGGGLKVDSTVTNVG